MTLEARREGGGLLLEEGGRVDDKRCPAWREVGSS